MYDDCNKFFFCLRGNKSLFNSQMEIVKAIRLIDMEANENSLYFMKKYLHWFEVFANNTMTIDT